MAQAFVMPTTELWVGDRDGKNRRHHHQRQHRRDHGRAHIRAAGRRRREENRRPQGDQVKHRLPTADCSSACRTKPAAGMSRVDPVACEGNEIGWPCGADIAGAHHLSAIKSQRSRRPVRRGRVKNVVSRVFHQLCQSES